MTSSKFNTQAHEFWFFLVKGLMYMFSLQFHWWERNTLYVAVFFLRLKALTISLKALKLAGVHGIGVEVWWGIVERFSPFAYNWSLYEELFQLISQLGLKLHVDLSFHSNRHASSSGSGGVSLPLWILEVWLFNFATLLLCNFLRCILVMCSPIWQINF